MIDYLTESIFFSINSNRQNQECRQKFEVTWLQQLDGTNSTTVWPLQVPYWWEQLEVWYLRPKYLRNPPCFLQVKLTFIFLSTEKCSILTHGQSSYWTAKASFLFWQATILRLTQITPWWWIFGQWFFIIWKIQVKIYLMMGQTLYWVY